MELGLLYLLLPVAAFSGWLIGRNGTNQELRPRKDFNADYFKGLNYLLNEQADKAIEVFVHMLDVDSETVETHFALGNLFLRRGEVDRAIRIHQNLIARPTLTRIQRQQALFELGKDYLRAGLLDRAETLFIQAAENSELAPLSLWHLLEVYQLEKEWQKAIGVAQRLKGIKSSKDINPLIAHFLCEEAEESLRNKHGPEAMRLVRKALDEDKDCVRASLLEAQMEIARQDYKKAIRSLLRIEYQDAAFLSEILKPLRESYNRLGTEDELLSFMERVIQQAQGGSSFVLFYAELIGERNGRDAAVSFLMHYLNNYPSLRVMKKLIEWRLQRPPLNESSELAQLNNIIGARLEGKPAYQCRNCGFTARMLNWQCPTCKQWNTVKPLPVLEDE